MYYAYYDPDSGVVLGFYSSEIHNNIPEPNIKLTYEDWLAALDGPRIVQNGQLQPYTPPHNDHMSVARLLEQINAESIAPLRTLVLDLARGISMPDSAVVARVKLQELEDRYHANV